MWRMKKNWKNLYNKTYYTTLSSFVKHDSIKLILSVMDYAAQLIDVAHEPLFLGMHFYYCIVSYFAH